MFKGLSQLAGLVSQARNLGEKMQTLQSELATQRATGRSGGDMVVVEVNGLGQVLSVKLDPVLVERRDQEMLEDLLPAAINDALAKSKELHVNAMQTMTGGLDLSSMKDMLGKFNPEENK
jgi:DNA-binding YbaB/EbfC family protein